MPDAGKGSRKRNHFAKAGKKVKRLWAAPGQLIRAVVKRRAD